MRRIAIVALAVWAITIAGGIYLFFSGYTTPGGDGREVVLLAPAERDGVLAEMRALLQATADITEALARNDNVAIAAIARPVGTAAMEGDRRRSLPSCHCLQEAGLKAHTGFDKLANAADGGATTPELTGMLAVQLSVCTGRHAAHRFNGN